MILALGWTGALLGVTAAILMTAGAITGHPTLVVPAVASAALCGGVFTIATALDRKG